MAKNSPQKSWTLLVSTQNYIVSGMVYYWSLIGQALVNG